MTELNTKIRELFPGKRIVAFYIGHTNVIPDEWMVALGRELQKRNYGTVGLLSGKAIGVMNLEGLDHVFQITQEDLPQLDSVACFIVTDFERGVQYSRTSRILAMSHSCVATGDPQAYLQGANSTSAFDGYIVGFPFQHRKQDIKALWDNFSPPSQLRRPATDFYLMGYGYPKLCLMRQKFLARQQESIGAKSICYAPTEIHHALYYGGNRVQQYGKRILRSLLSSFPDYSIIFRPTPMNRDEDIIRDIITYFTDEPRLVIDTQTSYLDTFVRTQVMVTDFAHIAPTFATITHKPAIYFQPWLKENGLHRDGLFYTTNSLSKLTLAVKHALALSPMWNDSDKKNFINGYGYLPFDTAMEELANDLGDFIDGRPHPDWLVIRRDKNSPGASAAKIMATILQENEELRLGHAREYTNYFLSRPLAVFTIHLHALHAPELTMPLWLQKLAGIASPEEQRTYGEFSPQDIAQLYRDTIDKLQAQSPAQANGTIVFLRQMALLAEQNVALQ